MMMKIIRAGVFVIAFLFFGGCFAKQPAKNVFKKCENTFVLSDGRKTVLFEHDENNVQFHLLKQYENWSGYGSFLDCQRNIIVSPYTYKGVKHDKGGVTIFTLHNDKSRDYEIFETPQGPALGRYKNGVLLTTQLMQKERVQEGASPIPILSYGMLFTDDQGIRWRGYTYTLLFDLDQKKVVKSYKYDLWNPWINGDVMVGVHYGFITEIDLNTGNVKNWFDSTPLLTGERNGPLSFSLSCFTSSGDFYFVPVPRKDSDAAEGYEKAAIYKIENKKIIKQVSLPDIASQYVGPTDRYLAPMDPNQMIAVDEHIYVFTRQSKKVFRFHTKTKELKAYDLKLPIPSHWYITSVGYTKENFIIPVTEDFDITGGVFVVNRDFSKISVMHALPMGGAVGIFSTTQENISRDAE